MFKDVFQLVSQKHIVTVMGLAVAVLISGMLVTYVKYESRKLFTEIEKLRVQRDEYAVDWSRLQLELATWAEQGRIKEKASERLSMHVPHVADMKVIKP